MRFLPAAALKLLTGLAVLLRSRFAVWLAVAWSAAFLAMFVDRLGDALQTVHFWLACSELAAIVLFIVLLRSKRLLR